MSIITPPRPEGARTARLTHAGARRLFRDIAIAAPRSDNE
jgi:hypothetical protein